MTEQAIITNVHTPGKLILIDTAMTSNTYYTTGTFGVTRLAQRAHWLIWQNACNKHT